MVVTVDGATATQSVPVSPAWPAIFSPGVLNQDGSVNGPASPAAAGQVLQIFLTGMPDNASVTLVIGNQSGIQPLYRGSGSWPFRRAAGECRGPGRRGRRFDGRVNPGRDLRYGGRTAVLFDGVAGLREVEQLKYSPQRRRDAAQ